MTKMALMWFDSKIFFLGTKYLSLYDVNTKHTARTGIFSNDVKKIEAGWYHAVVLKNNGEVYSSGSYSKGGNPNDLINFRKININEEINDISAGFNQTVLIGQNNVYALGYNYGRQFGREIRDRSLVNTPTKILKGKKIVSAALGSNHMLYLESAWVGDPHAGGCGDASHNQLGTTYWNDSSKPFSLKFRAKSIAAGEFYSLFLQSNNKLWHCGGSKSMNGRQHGKLKRVEAVWSYMDKVKAMAAGATHFLLLDEGDTAYCIHRECREKSKAHYGILNIAAGTYSFILEHAKGIYYYGPPKLKKPLTLELVIPRQNICKEASQSPRDKDFDERLQYMINLKPTNNKKINFSPPEQFGIHETDYMGNINTMI